jgi:uncharacterized membrane protein
MSVSRHLTRTLVAGLVALLPVGGLILTVIFAEDAVAESWLAEQAWYFPGMGLLAVALVLYVIGLLITTFFGRWAWRIVDALIEELPLLGGLYATLKQLLGYGEGKDAMFLAVVWVPAQGFDAEELGLVTQRLDDGETLVVFVPSSPTPTNGRMLRLPASGVRPSELSVHEALKALVSVGKTSLEPDPDAA